MSAGARLQLGLVSWSWGSRRARFWLRLRGGPIAVKTVVCRACHPIFSRVSRH